MPCEEYIFMTSAGEYPVPRSTECEVALVILVLLAQQQMLLSWQQANLPLKLTSVCFLLFFFLHSILHQSASVVHLKFFILRSVRSLGLNLYVALFLTLFFLSFFFFLFPTKQKIAFQGEKLPSPFAFILKSTSNWGMNVMNQWQNVSFWST